MRPVPERNQPALLPPMSLLDVERIQDIFVGAEPLDPERTYDAAFVAV